MAYCQIWHLADVCTSLSPFKEADTAYKPESRNHQNDWPTVVFKSGHSKGFARLRVNGRWWLVNYGGDVNIVIITIKPIGKSFRWSRRTR